MLTAVTLYLAAAAVFCLSLYRLLLLPTVQPGTVSAEAPLPAETELEPACPVFLTVGDSGEQVYQLEQLLAELGYGIEHPDHHYSGETAAAVNAFLHDHGMTEDGICTAALLSRLRTVNADSKLRFRCAVSPTALAAALRRHDCSPEEYGLRGALILFQRTHGLRGSGECGYATLCALGLTGNRPEEPLPEKDEDDVRQDLEITILARTLCAAAGRDPALCQLRTLTWLGCTILNRREAPCFPDSLSVLCAEGISAPLPADPGLYALCLRAAEEAFTLINSHRDPTGGALYWASAASPDHLPGNGPARTCGGYLFYRSAE